MGEYAHPEMLLTTEWVAQNRKDPSIRLVEVDVDTSAYNEGHISGAIGLNWQTQLCDQVRRDVLAKDQFEQLMSDSGIENDTTIVLYGDNNNWFATYALWQFRFHGHHENGLKLINGGRQKWIAEGRELVKEIPSHPKTAYTAKLPDNDVRASKENILPTIHENTCSLVDVRTPEEFLGEIIAPPGMSETAQRGGHIPGALNIPWNQAMREDNTFKSYDELKDIYDARGVDSKNGTITYCRIGERSSHTWFVLKYLLGHEKVRNYDGSWTEWGNLMGAPIEKG